MSTLFGALAQLASALHSHCKGHRFESGMLHHSPSENTVFGRIFYAKNTKRNHNPAQIAKKERVFPSEFRDFSDFWHSYPAVTVYEVMNASADVDCPSDVIGQGGESELGGDLFLALAEEITPVVVVLDGAEGMLAGLLAELLFGDVPLNEDHDALVVARTVVPSRHSVSASMSFISLHARAKMRNIAYVDETWTPEDDEDRKRTLETEAFHLESLKAVLEIAEKNGRSVVGQIRDILAEGEEHLRHLRER